MQEDSQLQLNRKDKLIEGLSNALRNKDLLIEVRLLMGWYTFLSAFYVVVVVVVVEQFPQMSFLLKQRTIAGFIVPFIDSPLIVSH